MSEKKKQIPQRMKGWKKLVAGTGLALIGLFGGYTGAKSVEKAAEPEGIEHVDSAKKLNVRTFYFEPTAFGRYVKQAPLHANFKKMLPSELQDYQSFLSKSEQCLGDLSKGIKETKNFKGFHSGSMQPFYDMYDRLENKWLDELGVSKGGSVVLEGIHGCVVSEVMPQIKADLIREMRENGYSVADCIRLVDTYKSFCEKTAKEVKEFLPEAQKEQMTRKSKTVGLSYVSMSKQMEKFSEKGVTKFTSPRVGSTIKSNTQIRLDNKKAMKGTIKPTGGRG